MSVLLVTLFFLLPSPAHPASWRAEHFTRCADVRKYIPHATDGLFVLYNRGNASRPFALRCVGVGRGGLLWSEPLPGSCGPAEWTSYLDGAPDSCRAACAARTWCSHATLTAQHMCALHSACETPIEEPFARRWSLLDTASDEFKLVEVRGYLEVASSVNFARFPCVGGGCTGGNVGRDVVTRYSAIRAAVHEDGSVSLGQEAEAATLDSFTLASPRTSLQRGLADLSFAYTEGLCLVETCSAVPAERYRHVHFAPLGVATAGSCGASASAAETSIDLRTSDTPFRLGGDPVGGALFASDRRSAVVRAGCNATSAVAQLPLEYVDGAFDRSATAAVDPLMLVAGLPPPPDLAEREEESAAAASVAGVVTGAVGAVVGTAAIAATALAVSSAGVGGGLGGVSGFGGAGGAGLSASAMSTMIFEVQFFSSLGGMLPPGSEARERSAALVSAGDTMAWANLDIPVPFGGASGGDDRVADDARQRRRLQEAADASGGNGSNNASSAGAGGTGSSRGDGGSSALGSSLVEMTMEDDALQFHGVELVRTQTVAKFHATCYWFLIAMALVLVLNIAALALANRCLAERKAAAIRALLAYPKAHLVAVNVMRVAYSVVLVSGPRGRSWLTVPISRRTPPQVLRLGTERVLDARARLLSRRVGRAALDRVLRAPRARLCLRLRARAVFDAVAPDQTYGSRALRGGRGMEGQARRHCGGGRRRAEERR